MLGPDTQDAASPCCQLCGPDQASWLPGLTARKAMGSPLVGSLWISYKQRRDVRLRTAPATRLQQKCPHSDSGAGPSTGHSVGGSGCSACPQGPGQSPPTMRLLHSPWTLGVWRNLSQTRRPQPLLPAGHAGTFSANAPAFLGGTLPRPRVKGAGAEGSEKQSALQRR